MDASRDITVPELAKRLGCSIPHAQALIRTGRIPGHRNSRGWVTTVAEVEKHSEGNPGKQKWARENHSTAWKSSSFRAARQAWSTYYNVWRHALAVRVAAWFTRDTPMGRLLHFLRLVLVLTVLMFGTWYLSRAFLPEGILRGYFAKLFSIRAGELTFWMVFLANLLPFFGIQFMNLFRVGKYAGGLYVLPVLWILVGVIYGTNSFVFAAEQVPFSISILWERTGFTELLAYTFGYEASRDWALWEQRGLWQVHRLGTRRWNLKVEDMAYWFAGLLLLVFSVAREVR